MYSKWGLPAISTPPGSELWAYFMHTLAAPTHSLSPSYSTMSAAPAVIEVDVGAGSGAKPAVAQRLEADAKKRQSLTKEDVESKLKEAEERRQKELDAKVEKAKELEGQKGSVDPAAAAKDAPPAGKEIAK